MPNQKHGRIWSAAGASSLRRSKIVKVRLILWSMLGVVAAIFLIGRLDLRSTPSSPSASASIGGPFTLFDGAGRPFSSRAISRRPYAIYFGFTRCGDICPTTLQRLVRLRRAIASDDAFNIVFVTIDPTHDGPEEVGQYAKLFGAPIIGLTGSPQQIEHVKRSFGIFAEPSPHPMPGKQMEHTASVLLFDSNGRFVGTISPDDPDQAALGKLKKAMA